MLQQEDCHVDEDDTFWRLRQSGFRKGAAALPHVQGGGAGTVASPKRSRRGTVGAYRDADSQDWLSTEVAAAWSFTRS